MAVNSTSTGKITMFRHPVTGTRVKLDDETNEKETKLWQRIR
jgi:hypothetical protein